MSLNTCLYHTTVWSLVVRRSRPPWRLHFRIPPPPPRPEVPLEVPPEVATPDTGNAVPVGGGDVEQSPSNDEEPPPELPSEDQQQPEQQQQQQQEEEKATDENVW